MKILVTGANGQLGRTLMDLSVEYGHEFIFTSRTAGSGVMPLDAADASAVTEMMKANAVDVVINCAGYTDVAAAESEVEAAHMLNVHLPAALASAAKETGAVLIHFSTDYVFDGKAHTPYGENSPANPLGVYAKTKLEGDRAVMESGCKYMIFRTSWLYSCHGKNFFKTIGKKVSESQSINVVNDQRGTPTYAVDLAEAVLKIIDGGMLDRTGLYNYSDEGECSWYDFAKAISEGLGYGCDVRPCSTDDYPSKVRRPAYSVLDKTLFKETFKISIPDWRDSLTVCIEEFRKIMQ